MFPPLEILWRYYAISAAVALLVIFTPLKMWSWKKWWCIFSATTLGDYLSTLLFVYVYGLGWQAESNEYIQKFGAQFGYFLVLNLGLLIPVAMGYLVGLLGNKISKFGIAVLFGTLSLLNFWVVIINVFNPIVDIPYIVNQ